MDDMHTLLEKPFSISVTKKIKYFVTVFVFISTLFFSYYTQYQNMEKDRDQFDLTSQQISLLISNRMEYYTQLLLGGTGLFIGSENVSREEWRKFSKAQHLDSKFLGIQGIGYSLVIKPDELNQHIKNLKDEGFKDYTVKPKGLRSLYTSIVFLEPFDERNKRAFGYDMFSEETRHKAMDKAVQTGKPSLSGKVRLLQENGTDEQAGFLVYIPVYKDNMPLNTKEQRYEAIQGFVYSPFRAKNLFANIIGNVNDKIGVEIYDTESISEESLLLRTFKLSNLKKDTIYFEDNIKINDRVWKLRFSLLSSHTYDITHMTPFIILIIGILLSIISFLFFDNLIKMERKKQNYIEELQSISLKKSLALKAATIGIWEWNFKTNTLVWDKNMYAIYGIVNNNTQSPYSMWVNAIDPKDKVSTEKVISRAVEKNIEYNHKFWIVTPKNERRYIHAIGVNELDSHSKAVRMVGTNIDITDQKLLEIKYSNEQEALLQVKTTGFIHLKGNNFIWTNKAFEEMFGYGINELEGKNINQICRDETCYFHNEKEILEVLSLKGTFSGEVSGVKKDGTEITILASITKLKDTKDEAMGVIMDITRQKVLEQNLQEEVEKKTEENFHQFQILQEQSKLASMGEMIGAIAHQWRQPLNELSIRIQKLKYNYENEQINEVFIHTFIEKNKKTIGFMSKTIDDFRNFFRIDKEKRNFQIKESIEEVISIQNAQLKNNNIILEMKGDDFLYNGYKTEFQQVIINIISNAKDALVSNKVKEPKIIIKIKRNNIKIMDNGGGIEVNLLKRIFEPYFTTKSQGEGTGMGLYISKMIIEDNMHGKINMSSNDNGTCVTIEFK